MSDNVLALLAENARLTAELIGLRARNGTGSYHDFARFVAGIEAERDAARAELVETRQERDTAERQVGEYSAEALRLGDIANAYVQQIDAAKGVRARIAEAHSKHVDEHGGTMGACNECSWHWPCPTYVWATTDRNYLACWDPADDEAPVVVSETLASSSETDEP